MKSLLFFWFKLQTNDIHFSCLGWSVKVFFTFAIKDLFLFHLQWHSNYFLPLFFTSCPTF